MLEISGAIFIIVAGCLLHFTYEWSGHNRLVGFFTAVNESTWEHLKLLIAPSLIWLVVEYFVYSGNLALLLAHFGGLMVGLLVIPLIFYAYKAIFKRDVLVIDILAFVLAAVAEQAIFYILIRNLPQNEVVKNIGLGAIIATLIFYLTATYAPIRGFLWKDPITGKYGVNGHWHPKKRKKR